MVVGIDLGTTHSLVAFWRDGVAHVVPNALGETLTPSVVGLDDQGLVLVGDVARQRLQTHPHLSCELFKRYMGSQREVRLGARMFRPEELSALVLRSLKEDVERFCGEPVTEAIISVPAYFSDAQRKAARVAGQLAGLRVERLVNEPTAAALAYGLQQRKESTFLVFDLGGGTFDVSILEMFDGVMEVRATAGDNFLGGEDFDEAIVAHVLARQPGLRTALDGDCSHLPARLRGEARRVRHGLGEHERMTFLLQQDGRRWEETITREQFQHLAEPLLERLRRPVERALRDARIKAADLDEVVLVGGATRMPLVRRLVAGLFGRIPAMHLQPDQVVAQGAAVQAALKQRDAALEDVVLTDICPYTLGIETSVELGRQLESGHYLPIIERNCTVPVSREKSIVTVHDGQTEVVVRIFQGENRLVKDNIFLGELAIAVPPRKAEEVELRVRFTYDINGLLEADVHIPLTGEHHRLVIEHNPGVLAPDEIAARLLALAALKVHPREQQVNTRVLARVDRLYEESLGEARAHVAELGRAFQQALESQDTARIDTLRAEIERQLDAFEGVL